MSKQFNCIVLRG